MSEPVISPLQRLVLAFYAFFAILFRADVAAAMARVRAYRRAGAPLPGPFPALEETGRAAPPSPAASAPVAEAPRPVAPPPAPAPAAAAPAPSPAPARAAPGGLPDRASAAVAAPAPVPPPAPDHREALHLLAVLQREGRLVDFIEEDLAGFPDAAIGAAARTVHAGCRRALEELFTLEPVLRHAEGATVTVDRGFDPSAVRLTGNVVGEPPFRGALRHHGWRAREVKIAAPAAGDPAVLAPAEVEL